MLSTASLWTRKQTANANLAPMQSSLTPLALGYRMRMLVVQ